MPKSIKREYEEDFYAWTTHNVKLLREGKLSEIDVEHIAEEIESMGKSEKRELLSRLAVLMAHLLKWKFQPARRSKSWALTIKNQRIELDDLHSQFLVVLPLAFLFQYVSQIPADLSVVPVDWPLIQCRENFWERDLFYLRPMH